MPVVEAVRHSPCYVDIMTEGELTKGVRFSVKKLASMKVGNFKLIYVRGGYGVKAPSGSQLAMAEVFGRPGLITRQFAPYSRQDGFYDKKLKGEKARAVRAENLETLQWSGEQRYMQGRGDKHKRKVTFLIPQHQGGKYALWFFKAQHDAGRKVKVFVNGKAHDEEICTKKNSFLEDRNNLAWCEETVIDLGKAGKPVVLDFTTNDWWPRTSALRLVPYDEEYRQRHKNAWKPYGGAIGVTIQQPENSGISLETDMPLDNLGNVFNPDVPYCLVRRGGHIPASYDYSKSPELQLAEKRKHESPATICRNGRTGARMEFEDPWSDRHKMDTSDCYLASYHQEGW